MLVRALQKAQTSHSSWCVTVQFLLLLRFSGPFCETENSSGSEAENTTSGPIAAVEENLFCKSASRSRTRLECRRKVTRSTECTRHCDRCCQRKKTQFSNMAQCLECLQAQRCLIKVRTSHTLSIRTAANCCQLSRSCDVSRFVDLLGLGKAVAGHGVRRGEALHL